ncbi:hypothetical protein DESUT3_34140 [Desulfuromonas versatilis]|uniref:ABC transporter permease n=1 Tax=Desulfuromonas versatilis TaxID=2802975 RepID=A0ABN6E1Z2_9BACT|nr:FtsX-like permease family protein [Desulfuromonas versatilis]BCR06345.1 hypothetical protein DESUT3_34140 [Desulfuromonas versatilis]
MNPLSSLQLRMALRNLRRNPRRSLITVTTIGFGLFCLIVFQALKVGLHREMVEGSVRLESGTVQIHAAGYEPNLAALRPLADPAPAEELLRQARAPYSRRIKAPAMLLAGAHSSTVLLSGVDPTTEPQVTLIAEKLVAGRFPTAGDEILLGAALAGSLGVEEGGEVTLMAQGLFGRPVTRRFTVGGLYRTSLAAFDRTHVYLPLGTAQEFLQAEELVTELAVRTEPAAASALAGELRARLDEGRFQVRDWRQMSPDLVQLIELNDATLQVLILIVFAIVALGIVNTMTMIIYERFRELGILSAIGMRPGGVVALICAESLCLGLVAALCGSLFGVAACLWLGSHGIDLTRFTSANQYFAAGHVIRAHLLPGDLLAANLLTLATAILGGLYPAWKASRLDPARAIRYS